MATSDSGIRMKDGKDISPGSVVACCTTFGERFEGEVLAFDYGTKFVVIKTPTVKGSKKSNSDVRMFNISNLSNFEIVRESFKSTQPLPALDLEKIEKRTKCKIQEKRNAVSRVGIDVTPEGQKLFDVISKQFNELCWEEKNIVIMDKVVISPPYSIENIHPKDGKDEQALVYIKGIVNKHYENEKQSQVAAK